jgi:hypothetical protein
MKLLITGLNGTLAPWALRCWAGTGRRSIRAISPRIDGHAHDQRLVDAGTLRLLPLSARLPELTGG